MFVEGDRSKPLHAVHCNLEVAGIRSVYKRKGGKEHLFVQDPGSSREMNTVKEIAKHVLFELFAGECQIKPSDVLGWYELQAK